LKNALREGSLLTTQTPIPVGVSIAQVIERCAEAAGWGTSGEWRVESGEQLAVSSKQSDANPSSFILHPSSFNSIQSLPPNPKALRRGRGFACALKNVGFSFGFPERCEATVELRGRAEIEQVILRHAGADVGQGAHTVFRQMAAAAVGVDPDQVELDVSDTATSGDSGSASASRMTFMAGNAIRQAAAKALDAWENEDRPAIGHARYVPPPTEALDP
jgi:hypothetical protein